MSNIIQNTRIISLEGNIGGGKSTLLQKMREKYSNSKNIIFVDEPVNDWEAITDEKVTPMLQLFYLDQKKHAFAFQMMAFISRLSKLKEAIENNPGKIVITERSLYTDKMVFAEMLYRSKDISHEHYQIYLKWFDMFAKDFPVHKIIYVNTPPKICYERISIRSRNGESTIPLEYLENCHSYHNNMLNKFSKNCICHDQITIDGSQNIYENASLIESWLEKINTFIHI